MFNEAKAFYNHYKDSNENLTLLERGTHYINSLMEKRRTLTKDKYEKQHSNRTTDYLDHNELLSQITDDNIPKEELNKIKQMYK